MSVPVVKSEVASVYRAEFIEEAVPGAKRYSLSIDFIVELYAFPAILSNIELESKTASKIPAVSHR
jgi:hypothetical protein